MPGVFLAARWQNLLMVNYEVDPALLQPLVPRGTELDMWQGRTFVSMVGFRFLQTCVLGLPVPGHRNFDEVNLRYYVRRRSGSEWLQGVVFVKEIVPRRAIAWVARALYNENYVRLPMRSTVHVPGRVTYAWRRDGRWEQLSAEVGGEPYPPDAGSEEAFITEHYWGYSRQRDGGTVQYQVEHPRWQVRRCEAATLQCDAGALYGAAFASVLAAPPSSAFLAEGSDVTVRRGSRI